MGQKNDPTPPDKCSDVVAGKSLVPSSARAGRCPSPPLIPSRKFFSQVLTAKACRWSTSPLARHACAPGTGICCWYLLNDVLGRLLAGETDYQPLLPWNWAAAHPESIRMYRQEERRERDVRKQTQRAKRRDNKKRQSKLKRK